MKRWSIAVGLLMASAMTDTATAQRMLTPTIPLNEIMPQLPPVPQPAQGGLVIEPCTFSTAVIPLGDMTPAVHAEQAPDGIVLSGDAASPPEQSSSSCPIPPD